MSADTDRTDPRTPDPLADALRIALDRLDAYIEGTDDESIIDGDTDEDREFIREARSALAALPSAPDQRLREALPFIRHRATCYLNAVRDNAPDDELCSCGLREFWLAALSEATTSPEPTLDVAWREAEAALPDGWQFELGRLDFDGPWDAFAKSRAFWEDDYRVADREEQIASGEGPTPAAALSALAARLRGPA